MDTPISARAAILQVLIDGPTYGLGVIERVLDRSGGRIRLGQGSVYPALRALESEGLLSSYEADPSHDRGGRPRRYYELTAEGLRSAREQGRLLSAFAIGTDPVEQGA